MPSCFLAVGSVRTRQKHQSAYWAPEVQIFWPLTRQWSPLSSAGSAARRGRSRRWARSSPGTSAVRPATIGGMCAASAPRCRTRAGSARTCRRPCRRWGSGADPRHFLRSTRASARREAAAAIFLRPGRRAPALVAHALAPELRVGALRGAAHHRGHLRGDVALQRRGKFSSSQPRASARKASASPPKSAMSNPLRKQTFEFKIPNRRAEIARKFAARTPLRDLLRGPASPARVWTTTLRFTSDVPPSIELALARSQPRVAAISAGAKASPSQPRPWAHGLDHQLGALLGESRRRRT